VTTAVVPTTAEHDEQQSNAREDIDDVGVGMEMIVIIVMGVLLMLSAAVMWRQRKSRSPSAPEAVPPPLPPAVHNAAFAAGSAYEAAHTLNPDYQSTRQPDDRDCAEIDLNVAGVAAHPNHSRDGRGYAAARQPVANPRTTTVYASPDDTAAVYTALALGEGDRKQQHLRHGTARQPVANLTTVYASPDHTAALYTDTRTLGRVAHDGRNHSTA